MLESLGRWTAVLDCLYIDAEQAEPDERAAIYETAAEIATVQLGPDAALPWLERLRGVRPDEPLILARIADVHRLAGRSESVLRTTNGAGSTPGARNAATRALGAAAGCASTTGGQASQRAAAQRERKKPTRVGRILIVNSPKFRRSSLQAVSDAPSAGGE